MPRICIGRCALSLGSAVSSRSARFPRGSLCVCLDSAGNEREDKGVRIDLDVALSNAGKTTIHNNMFFSRCKQTVLQNLIPVFNELNSNE